jgi:hypothetical protein
MRIVAFLFGVLLFVGNFFAYSGREIHSRLDTVAGWGYLVGYNLFFIAGVTLITLSFVIKSKKLTGGVYVRYMRQFIELKHDSYVRKAVEYLLKADKESALNFINGLSEEDKEAKNYLSAIVALSHNDNRHSVELLEEINRDIRPEFGDYYYLLSRSYRGIDDEKAQYYFCRASLGNTFFFRKHLKNEQNQSRGKLSKAIQPV